MPNRLTLYPRGKFGDLHNFWAKGKQAVTDLEKWQRDGEELKWSLPPQAAWPLRVWGIRHVRAVWNAWMVERHYRAFEELGLVRTGYDEWVLYAIARGLC